MFKLCPLRTIVFLLVVGGFSNARAQFNIVESFTRSTQESGAFELGDEAVLTASDDLSLGQRDEDGEGWLRLTPSSDSQKGYAFLNKSFPSTLGVLVEFDYMIWTNQNINQGDGFSVFLFDADKVSTEDFRIGGYGGSLGYARNGTTPPISGGYIGVGFDVHGNFSNPTEGRVGGEGRHPNHIVLRGPTTDSQETSNLYLTGIAPSEDSKIHYETRTDNRPVNHFYRRVRIIITATEDGNQEFRIWWKTSAEAEFTQILTYRTNEDFPGDLPENLKLGFAASTGSSHSFHEIRNLTATTPGNLRVENRTEVKLLHAGDPSDDRNKFEYTIAVFNDTDSRLTDIDFNDSFLDVNGIPVPENHIEIHEIVPEGFIETNLPTPNPSVPLRSNEFSGVLGLEAMSSGTIKVIGRLLDVPEGYELLNTAEISSKSIQEDDLSNNVSTVNIPVVAGGTDLKVELVPEDYCLENTGNLVNLRVSNLGEEDANFIYNSNGKNNNKIWIELEYPENVNLDFSQLDDDLWHRNDSFYSGNKILLLSKEEGNFPAKTSLSDLPITVTPNSGVTSYELKVKLSFLRNDVPVEVNLNNNEHTLIISEQEPPTLPIEVLENSVFCIGEPAVQLEANVSRGNTLLWYNSQREILQEAPTPGTEVAGITTYYVSQTNGYCESDLTEITIIVLGPQAGTIDAPHEVCKGNRPTITGSSAEPELEDIIVSYIWERSDDGQAWQVVSEADRASYEPEQGIYEEVYFRRWTTYSYRDKQCRSMEAAVVNVQPKACKIMVNPALPSHAYPY